MTLYIGGKAEGRLQLPQTPWYTPLVIDKQPARRSRRSKYGFELLRVGASVLIPYDGLARAIISERIRSAIGHRRMPGRVFTTKSEENGVRIRRVG